MNDNELLSAISGIIDTKLDSFAHEVRGMLLGMQEEINGLKVEMNIMKVDTRQMKEDVGQLKVDFGQLKGEVEQLKVDVSQLKEEVGLLKADVAQLKEDNEQLKEDVRSLKISNEHIIVPRLNTIEACYTGTYDRYRESVESYDTMQKDIHMLKRVVAEHSEKLKKIV